MSVVVDDLTRDIVYAVRSFRRAPLAALTIVATVALGLGLVAVVFTVYNLLLLRADDVRSPGELFAVEVRRWTASGSDENLPVARTDYEALRRETSVFTETLARLDPMGPVYIDGRFARHIFVSGNFFQVLGVQAALGRPLLPDDDEQFAGRRVIALSHAGWRKLFQGDPNVIGRRVMVGGVPHEIVGVMPDGFRGLGIMPPDYFAPLALAGPVVGAEPGRPEANAFQVIGRLKPALSREAAAAALSAWATGRADFKAPPGRPIQVSLTPSQGTLPFDALDPGTLALFAPLFLAFGMILLIGCANVANLLLARGLSRQREIGIRLSLGASRRRVIRQLLTESLILSLAAAACGLVVARLFLEAALHTITVTLPPEIAEIAGMFNLATPTSDWRVWVFMIAGAILSTVFFGLTPALQATRIDVMPTMRGEPTAGARPRRARHALIAVQVWASALLLICAGIFLRGTITAATSDPGIRTRDTLWVSLDKEPRRAAIIQALIADPAVARVAASSVRSSRGTMSPAVPADGAAPTAVPVHQQAVSSGYFELKSIGLATGRDFEPAERTADGVVIVSETIARQFWPQGDGVGQRIRFDAEPSATPDAQPMPSGIFTVIGVVRDPESVSTSDLDKFRRVYMPIGLESTDSSLMVRVRGNPDQVRKELLERLARVDPAPVIIVTLRSLTALQSYLLQMAFYVSVVLGGLALALTVSGLFSVLSYVVEQQAKEIGVRMALGATTRNVMRLILGQSVRPVAIGLAAGGGLAAAVAIMLVTIPDVAAEMPATIDVSDPAAYVASLLVIVTSCALAVSVPALRAARIDPMATLRND